MGIEGVGEVEALQHLVVFAELVPYTLRGLDSDAVAVDLDNPSLVGIEQPALVIVPGPANAITPMNLKLAPVEQCQIVVLSCSTDPRRFQLVQPSALVL